MSLVREVGHSDFLKKEEALPSSQLKKENSGNSSFLNILKNIQSSAQILISDTNIKANERLSNEKHEFENLENPIVKKEEIENKKTETSSDDKPDTLEEEKEEKTNSKQNRYSIFKGQIEKAASKLTEVLVAKEPSENLEKSESKQEKQFDFREFVENLLFEKKVSKTDEIKIDNNISDETISEFEDSENEDDFLIDDPRFFNLELFQYSQEILEKDFSNDSIAGEESIDEFEHRENPNNSETIKISFKQDISSPKNNEGLNDFLDSEDESKTIEMKSEKLQEEKSLIENGASEKKNNTPEKEVNVSFLDKSKWQIKREKEEIHNSERVKSENLEAKGINSLKDFNSSNEKERGSFDDKRSGQFFFHSTVSLKDKSTQKIQPNEEMLKSEKFQKSLNNLVRQAKVHIVENGKSSAQVSLHPKELGKVLLNVTIEKNRVEGKIVVESETVKAAVATEMANLKIELKSVGLSLDNLQIEVGGNGNFMNFAKDDNFAEEKEGSFRGNNKLQEKSIEENGILVESLSSNILDIKI
ncbi:MAG: flagellar hook-length control protein FliK [Leptospiraceae bacterium]|nr:flagellar hook-length control protein FliK [Leptospiraceae bacterium]MCK6380750.1 flagellar hook-length control protein FliK [Leptospiraceae bacterium]NUM42318.1 flagellar hook-length control protein FliK [Leptospiraceae bacterium]